MTTIDEIVDTAGVYYLALFAMIIAFALSIVYRQQCEYVIGFVLLSAKQYFSNMLGAQ